MRFIIPVLLCLVACGQKTPPFEPISPEPLTVEQADQLQVEAVCRFVADCTRTETYEECLAIKSQRHAGCRLDDELARRCIERWRDAKCISGLEGDDWAFFHEHKTEILGPDPDPCKDAFHHCAQWYPATVDVPTSSADDGYVLAPRVTLDRQHLTVDGIRIVDVEAVDGGLQFPGRFTSGMIVTPLHDTLVEKLADQRTLAQMTGDALDASFALGVARDVPFSLVLPVLYTAYDAAFERFGVEVAAGLESRDGMMALYTVSAWLATPFPPRTQDPSGAYCATVTVRDDGYHLERHERRTALMSSPNAPDTARAEPREEVDLPCRGEDCSTPDAYDAAGLTAQMVVARETCPDCEQVLILVEPTIPWEVVVQTLDATRENAGGALFPRPQLWMSL